MAWQRGFFRLWIVVTVLWIIGCSAILGPESWREWQQQRQIDAFDDAKTVILLPVDCSAARGTVGKLRDKADYELSDEKCWYQFPDFRRLFPEYVDLSDADLRDKMYRAAGIEIRKFQPFRKIAELFGFALVPPLLTLALGMAIAWVLKGFRVPAGQR